MRGTVPARARRAVAVLLMAGAALLVAAPPASAHAQLEVSDPIPGEVRAVAPKEVTLTFGEPVERADGAIRVFDDHLRLVSTGPVTAVGAEGNRLSVSLPPNLSTGTYTVGWQVSSTDTHPVSGSFRFSIGAPSTVTAGATGTGRNDLAGALLGGARGLGYVGLALGPGLLLVVLALWRDGLSERRTTRLLWVGLGLLVASTVGGMLLQGVWADGQPFSAIWSSPATLDTHSRRFDQIYAVRFYLVVAFGITLTAALSRRAPAPPPATAPRRGPANRTPALPPTARVPWVLALAATTSAALMATWAVAGHASAGSEVPLAVAANLVHLMAMSTWLGGLALVAIALRPARLVDDLAAVMPRFSRLAFGCVVVIVLTGTYLAWREVGSVDALRSTEYGRLLLVKLAAVLALLGLGNLARRWVQRHLPSAPRRPALLLHAAGITSTQEMTFRPQEYGRLELARLHRGVIAELGVAGAVLALTSALVVIVPARQDYVAPFHRTVTTAALTVDLDLSTPRVGDAVLRVTARTPDGRAAPLTAVRGSMTQAAAGLGPLALEPLTAGGASPAGVNDLSLTLPAQGSWTLNLTVQTSPVDETSLTTEMDVP